MNPDRRYEFPSYWHSCQLSDIALVKGGKRLPAGEDFAEGPTPFPYLRVTDMVNGTIEDSNIAFVKPEIEPFIRNYKVSSGDLYVTIAGTLGQFGRIPTRFDQAQLTENSAKITDIDCSQVDKTYFTYFLRSGYVASQVSIATGVSESL